MTIELVFASHSTTEDNEAGRATGWLPGSCQNEAGRKLASWDNDAAATGSPPYSAPT